MSIATIFGEEPRWALMWQLALAIYIGCKALTWWTTPTAGVSLVRQLGYLLAWPGLDAPAFFHATCLHRPSAREWLFAAGKLLLGVALIAGVYPRLNNESEL